MHSLFYTFLLLGFEHIADVKGYDHILFIVALCAIYTLREWRKVAILATAFTIGHSLTLGLAALDIIAISPAWIEFLIPVTILVTGLYNVLAHPAGATAEEGTFGNRIRLNYLIAALFGLIHGLGFSNYFKAMVSKDNPMELVSRLFAFNLGVELGQLLIVLAILMISALALGFFRIKQREWNLFISGGAAMNALILALERLPF
ncbi:MAG: HupE/UreJ family protein [Haliscomenobacter sp.]